MNFKNRSDEQPFNFKRVLRVIVQEVLIVGKVKRSTLLVKKISTVFFATIKRYQLLYFKFIGANIKF
jgi:hypothetical protein